MFLYDPYCSHAADAPKYNIYFFLKIDTNKANALIFPAIEASPAENQHLLIAYLLI